jgi:hypothetical protein
MPINLVGDLSAFHFFLRTKFLLSQDEKKRQLRIEINTSPARKAIAKKIWSKLSGREIVVYASRSQTIK